MYTGKQLWAIVPITLTLFSTVFGVPQGVDAPTDGHDLDSRATTAVNTTICNGKTYVYRELAGYGYIPSNARDKYGDTLGGFGSAIVMDKTTWRKDGKDYKGLLYALPDRGWNTNGTLNYQNRVHKIQVTFTPDEGATVVNPSAPNIDLKYMDTILFTDPSGDPTTGLDAGIRGPYKNFSTFPFELPSVHYTGNGFGGEGKGGFRVTVDSEGLFLGHDGTFWVSDEYGPYVYNFNQKGKMIGAIRPPNAFIPLRNNSISWSADSPPIYAPNLEPEPHNNPTGRNNNQGFEGLTTNPAGTKLYTLLQSAINQDGGLTDSGNRYSRFLIYDITTSEPTYEAEYVVPLPHVQAGNASSPVAAQSEIHYISDTQFLVLARDKDAGRGQDTTESLYRHADVFDISNATIVNGEAHDCYTCHVATEAGRLLSDIVPAEYCPWLDYNVNRQLERFGVHNGGKQNRGLLNEKWESFALLPVHPDGAGSGEEFYLFSLSDNDFITQDGYMNFGKYRYQDSSGYSLRNQALVFKVKLPAGAEPLIG